WWGVGGGLCGAAGGGGGRGDIMDLARHFLVQLDPEEHGLEIDETVREYLLLRDYPGNVRDLRRIVASLHLRHAGGGPITIGDVPEEERPATDMPGASWRDGALETAIGHALEVGASLKEISHAASELAIKHALEREQGNLRRAATRLGVTDRALQLRRANRQPTD